MTAPTEDRATAAQSGHTVVFAVVDAPTETDALAAARAAFDRLTGATPGRDRVFDYCLTLDRLSADHPTREAGLPPAARVETERGTDLLAAAWAATVHETRAEVARVRRLLAARDPAAIRRDEDGVRAALARLGAPESPTTALYDGHGLGLVRRERVVDTVAACDQPWVVPADAHHHP